MAPEEGYDPPSTRVNSSPSLPFDYSGMKMVDRRVIETRPPRCKLGVLPLSLAAREWCLKMGLNHRRAVLQTAALPLSYSGMVPGDGLPTSSGCTMPDPAKDRA